MIIHVVLILNKWKILEIREIRMRKLAEIEDVEGRRMKGMNFWIVIKRRNLFFGIFITIEIIHWWRGAIAILNAIAMVMMFIERMVILLCLAWFFVRGTLTSKSTEGTDWAKKYFMNI